MDPSFKNSKVASLTCLSWSSLSFPSKSSLPPQLMTCRRSAYRSYSHHLLFLDLSFSKKHQVCFRVLPLHSLDLRSTVGRAIRTSTKIKEHVIREFILLLLFAFLFFLDLLSKTSSSSLSSSPIISSSRVENMFASSRMLSLSLITSRGISTPWRLQVSSIPAIKAKRLWILITIVRVIRITHLQIYSISLHQVEVGNFECRCAKLGKNLQHRMVIWLLRALLCCCCR